MKFQFDRSINTEVFNDIVSTLNCLHCCRFIARVAVRVFVCVKKREREKE